MAEARLVLKHVHALVAPPLRSSVGKPNLPLEKTVLPILLLLNDYLSQYR